METQKRSDLEHQHEAELRVPSEIPILALNNTVVYPLTMIPLTIGDPRSIKLVHDVVVNPSKFVGLFAIKNDKTRDPGPTDIYMTGTAAIIHRLIHVSDSSVQLIVQGIERVLIKEFTTLEPYLKAQIEISSIEVTKSKNTEALMRNTMELLRKMIALASHIPEDLMTAAINVKNPLQFVYIIATSFKMELQDSQELLEQNNIDDKLAKLNMFLSKEIEILELGRKIQTQAQTEMNKTQRDYILREQLKQIRKELGEEEEQIEEIKEYEKKIFDAHMSEEAEKEAKRELKRMRTMPQATAEYHVIRTYLETLIELPWNITTEDNLDIDRARQILDEDHYDLKDIKARILEFLSVRKLRFEREKVAQSYKGSILCFVGPPGVGKTSLGQSIARALGRKFIRMSLGGMHDESEIRGHRRTYIGAMPGRIIENIKRAKVSNPVMMLDEIDKIGSDYRGDPSFALLEVLDPEQNKTFNDHYLDVDFDLSRVIFICTANQLDTIQAALRDRMEILTLHGYTEDEKLHIAKNYLIPRQTSENALKTEEIQFEDAAIRNITRNYTREAGVRNLEREIGSVIRKAAIQIAENKITSITVTKDNLKDFLSKPKFYSEVSERTTIPGVATGLAVTTGGGDILFIEATKMPGAKKFILTGQLGAVMKESAQAALSYIRSKAKDLGISEKTFEKSDIHLHVPEGAIQKDGPSAGVAMATALASLMTNRLVKSDVGMTGEITLRGRVLPVGGIKEKVLAAHRAGLKTVILPMRNEKDLDDLPDEVKKELKFVFAEDVNDVIQAALCPRAPVKHSKKNKKHS